METDQTRIFGGRHRRSHLPEFVGKNGRSRRGARRGCGGRDGSVRAEDRGKTQTGAGGTLEPGTGGSALLFAAGPMPGAPYPQVSSMIRTMVVSTSCAVAAAPGAANIVSSIVGLIVARMVRPPSS